MTAGGGQEVGSLDLTVDLSPLAAARSPDADADAELVADAGAELVADADAELVADAGAVSPVAELASEQPPERLPSGRRRRRERTDPASPLPVADPSRPEKADRGAPAPGAIVSRRSVVSGAVRTSQQTVVAARVARVECLPEGGLPTERWDVARTFKIKRVAASDSQS